MPELIDLSQEIFAGMPVFKGMPEVTITVHRTHENTEGMGKDGQGIPMVNFLQLAEHTGTHVDAFSHMSKDNAGQTVDTMPLSMFVTEGICLDLSKKGLREFMEPSDLEGACIAAGHEYGKAIPYCFTPIITGGIMGAFIGLMDQACLRLLPAGLATRGFPHLA
jgi:kynurenine formamidase